MLLTNELWFKAVNVYQEAEKRNEPLGRRKLKDVLGVSEQLARELLFALDNKDIIKNQPQEFEVEEKCLVTCDYHIPYHDKSAVDTMMRFAEKYQPNIIVILGDLLDFYQVSFFAKNPKNPRIIEEIQIGREFLTELRNKFPKARIIYKEGNHSFRIQRYIFERVPDISDLLDDLLPNKLHLNDLGIQYVVDPFKIGKLYFLHGHEINKRGNPEYICNTVFKRVLDNCLVGHFHREQEKKFKRIDGKFLWVGSVGCLCQNLEYAPINQWNQGFAIVDYDSNGNFRPSLKEIVNGEIIKKR